MKPWGRTFWFYRGDGCEEGNYPSGSPRLPQFATMSPRGICTPNPYPFPPKSRRTFRLPGQTRTLYQYKDICQKASLRPSRAQEFEGWPINGFDDHPQAALRQRVGPRSAKTQAHKLQGSLGPRSSLSRANTDRIPTNRMSGSQLSYPAKQPPSLTNTPAKGPTSVKKKSHFQSTPWAVMEG